MASNALKMNDSLRLIYSEIDQDVTRVHAYWKLFRQLFGTDESVAILNNAGGFVIRAIQDALRDCVILKITRLTDPAASLNKHENMSLERLMQEIENDGDSTFCGELKEDLDRVRTSAAPFKLIRDKRIAHRDKAYALGSSEFPDVQAKRVDAILRQFRKVMRTIQRKYGLGRCLYRRVELGRDGNSLLLHLLCGKAFVELNEGAERGSLNANDVFERVKKLPAWQRDTASIE